MKKGASHCKRGLYSQSRTGHSLVQTDWRKQQQGKGKKYYTQTYTIIYLILNEQNVLVCRDGLFFLLIQEIQTSQIKNAFDSIIDCCITNHHSRFIVKKVKNATVKISRGESKVKSSF